MTVVLEKHAYGEPTVEFIFNRQELFQHFAACGLVVRSTLESIPYDLTGVIDEPVASLTYLCERVSGQ